MADVRKLQDDVQYWVREISILNNKLRDATAKLNDRQRELKRALDDEARKAASSNKKAA